MTWRTVSGRSRQGVSMSTPCHAATERSIMLKAPTRRLGPRRHGRIAPFASESESSGTTSASSKYASRPRPSQTGQAPRGLLKEKLAEVSTSNAMPQSVHSLRSL